jgi:dolichyl-phosphate-mannose-protein mannosyltransferase/PA14 domain-containing protein
VAFTLTGRRRAGAVAIALATFVAVPLMSARRFDPLPDGLQAQYFLNGDWRGEAARSNPASRVSADQIAADFGGPPPGPLSVAWNGWLVAPSTGAYTFATASDDSSWVYVDGQLVVENSGAGGSRSRAGPTIVLQRGVHLLFVKYAHTTGAVDLTVLWQRGSGRFDPVPGWALRPRRIGYARFCADRAGDGFVALGWRPLIAAIVVAIAFAFWPETVAGSRVMRDTIRVLDEEGVWRPLIAVMAGSTLLNVAGLWWGLPYGAWVGDELVPTHVAAAMSHHFVHGWFDKYPPLHYYLLALSYQPLVAVERLFGLPPRIVETLLIATGRLLSVAMGALTVVVVFLCGRRALGPRAGIVAAAMWSLVTPFVYYAKAGNVDVPYVMWFACSLLFYLRVLEGGTTADYVLWALTAAFAVCTKDQAYGLFVAMPLVVIYEKGRAAFDRRLAVAALTAAVAFAGVYLLPFNLAGFAGHVNAIVGGSRGYRSYEPTVTGRLALLGDTIQLVERNCGWPMFVVIVAGVALALASRSRRRVAVWLLAPAVSYYLTFINLVLYNYDRFLLPVCAVLVLFGGYAVDRFVSSSSMRVARWVAVTGVFVYTLLYSATVDALMLTDSRYAAERWLRAHVTDDDLVATSSIATYMPRMDGLNAADVYDRDTLDELRPRFFVLNADYTLTEPADTPLGGIISTIRRRDGPYRLALSVRSPNPWPWLPGAHTDLVGSRRDVEMVSFLRNVNPTIEIYERRR